MGISSHALVMGRKCMDYKSQVVSNIYFDTCMKFIYLENVIFLFAL